MGLENVAHVEVELEDLPRDCKLQTTSLRLPRRILQTNNNDKLSVDTRRIHLQDRLLRIRPQGKPLRRVRVEISHPKALKGRSRFQTVHHAIIRILLV